MTEIQVEDKYDDVNATLKRATDRLIKYTLIYRKQRNGSLKLTPKQRRRLTKKDRLLTTAPILRKVNRPILRKVNRA